MQIVKPNLFIPGAAKSGTTSLHELLDLHPDICMSSEKEPVYWNSADYDLPQKIKQYNAIFENKEAKVIGESTTSYMYYPEFISSIKQHYTKAPKFIFILRNPIDRCYSHYWWMVGRGQEKRDFKSCMTLDLNRPFEKYGYHPNFYYHFGRYGHWLTKFYQQFEANTIKIITLEELIHNRLQTINACYIFLELSPLENIAAIKSNPTAKLKYPKLYHFMRKTAMGKYQFTKPAKYFLSKENIETIKTKLKNENVLKKSVPLDYPKMTKDDRVWLRSIYDEDINQLKKVTGQSFDVWSDFKS